MSLKSRFDYERSEGMIIGFGIATEGMSLGLFGWVFSVYWRRS